MEGLAGSMVKTSALLLAKTCSARKGGNDRTGAGPDGNEIPSACLFGSSPLAVAVSSLFLGAFLVLLPIASSAAPAMLGHQPASGATVPLDFTVQAAFNESLDPGSVTAGNFTLCRAGTSVIAAGGNHTVAVKGDGSPAAWGLSTPDQEAVPGGLSGISAVAAGDSHSVALKSDRTVVAWGDNSYGQTAVPSGLSGVTAIAAGGNASLALKSDGTVVAWGDNSSSLCTVPSGLSGVTAIATGGLHAVALKKDGTVVAWGDNSFGQTTLPAGLSGVIAVAAGRKHTLALKRDGTVVAWGDNTFDQTSVPAGLSGIIAVAAGRSHALALKNDGSVVAWGRNDSGQCTVPANLSGIVAFAGGETHSVGLKSDGTVLAWGGNDFAQSAVPSALVALVPVVSGALAYDPVTFTVTFTPSGPANGAAVYYAEVGGIRNQSGVPTASPVGWGFLAMDTASTSVAVNPLMAPLGGTGTTQTEGAQLGVLASTTTAVQFSVLDGSGHGWPLYASIAIAGPASFSAQAYTNPVTGINTLYLNQGSSFTVTVNSAGYNTETRVIRPVSGGNTETFALTVDRSYCAAPGYPAPYFTNLENNAGGYYTDSPAIWSCGTPTNQTVHSGSTACFSDFSGGGHLNNDSYLYSPLIDLSANAGNSLSLSWWQMLYTYYNEVYYLDVSKDGGSTWSQAYEAGTYFPPQSETTWTRHSVTLDPSYAVGNFKVRFNFWGDPTHNTNAYWYIDDVAVQATNSCPLQPGGLLIGRVSDPITAAGINKATLFDGAIKTAYSTATPEDISLVDGFYAMFLPAGAHDVTASAPGFLPHTVAGVIISSDTIKLQDFALNAVPVLVTTSNLPFGISGTGYLQTLSATGGRPAYTWSITSGTLPDGLTLNGATGAISGTPTVTGPFSFTVQASDSIAVTAVKTLGITIYNPLSITPATLPFAVTGSAYNQTVVATGGLAPYVWSISAGALPAGLTLNAATGFVSGTPTASGTFNFTVQATVANGNSATQPLSIAVCDPLVILSGNLYYTAGAAYSQTLAAAGGKPPYSWAIVSGALPADTSLDGSTGIISGTSAASGNSSFTIRVTDANASVVNKDVSLSTYLRVIDFQPTGSGSSVRVNTVVQATFSDALDPATAGAGSLTLFRSWGTAKAIAAGGGSSEVLNNDGTVTAWGGNGFHQSTVPLGISGVSALATSFLHTLALKNDGTVAAWGYNSVGQASVPGGLSGVIAVAAGWWHSVALKSNGVPVAWGMNDFGQTTIPAGLTGVVAVAAGNAHTVALKSDGKVVAWGDNGYGQTTVPAGLSGVVAIAAGYGHTVALKNDGTVVAWGYNGHGQTTVPPGLSGVVAIAAGDAHTVCLKKNGTVVAWGYDYNGQATVPAGLSGVVAIAAGERHTLAMKDNGLVVAWGGNSYGEATVPAGLSALLNTVSGTVAYDAPSRTITFAPSTPLLPNTAYYANVASVVASQTAVPLAAPVNWSFSTYDLDISTALPRGIIGAGYSQALAASGGLAPYTWTIAPEKLPPGLILDSGTGVVSGTPTTAGAFSFSVQVLDANGVVITKQLRINIYYPVVITPAALPFAVKWSAYSQTLSATGGLSPYNWSIVGGTLPPGLTLNATTGSMYGTPNETGTYDFTVKVADSDGSNVTRSYSVAVYNRLLISSFTPANGAIAPLDITVQAVFSDHLDPSTVTAEKFFLFQSGAAKAVAAGGGQIMALRSDGTVAVWGNNSSGQATLPTGLSGVRAIAAGGSHSVALTSGGTLAAWGDNSHGQATIPGNLSGVSAVAAGGSHSLALKNDGTVVAWGDNGYGQAAVPANLSGVSTIAAGGSHSMALKSDGTVVAWGNNYSGCTTVPAGLSGVKAVAAGGSHSVALKNDGTVVAWGDNHYGQAAVPAGLWGVSAIAAGQYHTVALKTDGTVVAWGFNYSGQTTIPAGLPGVAAIAAGYGNTVALKSDGTVVAWGYNGEGQTSIPAGLTASGNRVSATVTYDDASQTATLTPEAPLVSGVGYDVALKGITGDHGVPLTAPARWSFTASDMIDLTPPLSSIARPLANAELGGSVVTISGTATDAGGYGVRKVEVSTDGGTTWQPASGTANWSYQWTLPATGEFTIKSRATDLVGNEEIPGAGTPVTAVSWVSIIPIRFARLPALGFDSFKAAYGSALDDDVIQSQALSFYEDILFDRNAKVQLKGGYDGVFSDNSQKTTINGMIRINNGTVRMENLRFN